ncbi:hypothetical protein N7478_011925 [Penicillium angulare]|uniref:uncharacterized protein n=1 Tax=Penicillium angulare TaxID=116970 RepID=UPI0025410EB7|nr:uncharacterized protein N7478_011925 [Penicillium angulare]KAJ5261330.1 hypothetical protein N7478_011925 [Penicillium angulare]
MDNVLTTWIEHNAPPVNQAWAFQKAIESKRTPPNPPDQIAQRKDRFRIAIRTLLPKLQNPEFRNAFEDATTWEDVRAEAQKAMDHRFENRKSMNPFRKTIRAIGNVASRLEFLTVLLPSGDYIGLLCGGLKLAYNAANRMSAVRSVILNSLDALSYPIQDTAPYFYVYAWNDTLMDRAHALYVTILDAVEKIMTWIAKSQGVRGGLMQGAKALFEGDDYGQELEDAVTTAVSEKASQFEAAVRTCLSIEVHDIGLNVVHVGKELDQMHGDMTKLLHSNVSAQSLENLLREQLTPCRRETSSSNKQWPYSVSSNSNDSNLIVTKAVAELMERMDRSCTPQRIQPTISLDQILAALDLVNIRSNSSDTREEVISTIGAERNFVFFFGRTLPGGVQGRISSVLRDHRFQHWLQGIESRVLVIPGSNSDPLQEDTVSPLSYMCALLMRSVSSVPFIHTITFFCRLHLEPKDGATGASGIMRSLIAQTALSLAESDSLDLTYLGDDFLELITMDDLVALCRLFEDILKPLDSGVIICMIDGMDFFDNSFNLPGMDLIMPFLNSLVGNIEASNSGLVFKLLVTSHMGGGYYPEWFPIRSELSMIDHDVLDDGVDVNELAESLIL